VPAKSPYSSALLVAAGPWMAESCTLGRLWIRLQQIKYSFGNGTADLPNKSSLCTTFKEKRHERKAHFEKFN
jgi:hypothetical protein